MICLTFVVATVFELTALLIMKQKSEEKVGLSDIKRSSISDDQRKIRKIDKIFVVIFPSSFIIFNAIYVAIMINMW